MFVGLALLYGWRVFLRVRGRNIQEKANRYYQVASIYAGDSNSVFAIVKCEGKIRKNAELRFLHTLPLAAGILDI